MSWEIVKVVDAEVASVDWVIWVGYEHCDVDPVKTLVPLTTTSCIDSRLACFGTVPLNSGALGGSLVDLWTPLVIILAHKI